MSGVTLLSGPVLAGAGLLASPALYQAVVTGGVPVETALVRYAVAALACWVGLSLLALLVGEPPTPEPVSGSASNTSAGSGPGSGPGSGAGSGAGPGHPADSSTTRFTAEQVMDHEVDPADPSHVSH